MTDNATNLTNAANLTTQLERMPSVYTNLKAFFLGSYTGNVLLAILIGVTIMLFFFEYTIRRKQKHIERIQQEYGKLLKPDAIKLEYDKGILKHSLQDDLDFEDFLSEVKKHKKNRKYKLNMLYEKTEIAVNEGNELVGRVPERIKEIANTIIKKECPDFILWNGEGDKPLGDYIDIEYIPHCIENINEGKTLNRVTGKDGRYVLQCPSTFAKTTSNDKIEKLKELIEKLATDSEVKNTIKRRDDAEKDINQALKEYNDKLAEIIRDLRMYPRGGFLR
jgi:hypothetical protein